MDFSHLASDFMATVSQLPSPVVYCTIVGILLICGFGVPIPEDITLLVSGLLASSGKISLPGAVLAGLAGVLAGDSILFHLGRNFGKKVFQLPGLRNIFTPPRIETIEARVRRNGPFICFIARFVPGLRSGLFAMSGALGVRPLTFILLDGFAALISVPLWTYAGYWCGKNFEDALGAAMEKIESIQIYIVSALGILILAYLAFRFLQNSRKRN
jgi:membrane protein DedA with SNARE-associated domain